MNKSELIEAIAKSSELTKADAERALNATIETIVKAVAKGDTVTLVGFGTFKSSKRAARTGRNPATGAAIKIAASTVPRFIALHRCRSSMIRLRRDAARRPHTVAQAGCHCMWHRR